MEKDVPDVTLSLCLQLSIPRHYLNTLVRNMQFRPTCQIFLGARGCCSPGPWHVSARSIFSLAQDCFMVRTTQTNQCWTWAHIISNSEDETHWSWRSLLLGWKPQTTPQDMPTWLLCLSYKFPTTVTFLLILLHEMIKGQGELCHGIWASFSKQEFQEKSLPLTLFFLRRTEVRMVSYHLKWRNQ